MPGKGKRPRSVPDAQKYGVPDAENPEWTEADFRNAKPFAEVFPDLAAQERARLARLPGRGPRKADPRRAR